MSNDADYRFFIYRGKPHETYRFDVCDAAKPAGERVIGRFKDESLANLFLDAVRKNARKRKPKVQP